MTERFEQLLNWLNACPTLAETDFTPPVPASEDASFRRYYRITITASSHALAASYVIMDAPPEHEDCVPFITVSQQLSQMGLNVPNVVEQDLTQGFLLLTDLGNTTYFSALTDDNVDTYYNQAFDALITLQTQGKALSQKLPAYNATRLSTENNLFSDWLIGTHLDLSLSPQQKSDWEACKTVLTKNAIAQPQVYVHRDFHSRNLMDVSMQAGFANNPGILDYQDAVKGALTYDVVSLIRDCYLVWPVEQVKEWQRHYFLKSCEAGLVAKSDYAGFVKAMDITGVQRHVKAAGIFARLNYRDGKAHYLNDVPATLNYIEQIAGQYKELVPLAKLVEGFVKPAMAGLR